MFRGREAARQSKMYRSICTVVSTASELHGLVEAVMPDHDAVPVIVGGAVRRIAKGLSS